jgi:transposase
MVQDRISAANESMLMRRYELTDEQYAPLEPYLPRMQRTDRRSRGDHQRMLNGLFWALRSGVP